MTKPTTPARKNAVAPVAAGKARHRSAKGKTGKPPPLVVEVRAALDGWQDWAESTVRGVISPVQFLALVLYVLAEDGTTPEQEELIVVACGQELLNACKADIVIPLDPVTCLRYAPRDGDRAWMLSIDHANLFLQSMPVGFDCAKVAEFFRLEAAKKIHGDGKTLTYEQAKASRTSRRGRKWLDAEKDAVIAEIKQREGESSLWGKVAKELGISEQTLRSNLKPKDGDNPQKSRPPKEDGGGGAALHAVWRK
nr:hypothetical protein [uncultured Albidiferax sp.]